MRELVVVRHGQSISNKENRFTGWADVGLSETGIEEAEQAGTLLRTEGYCFDTCYTSVLKRAIKTLWIILEKLDLMYLPVVCTWRLNERHYGALQGQSKTEVGEIYGDEQLHRWRRGYEDRPPALKEDDSRSPAFDPRYSHLASPDLPLTESLQDTLGRLIPFWEQAISTDLKAGRRVLVSAHGNSLRALIKYLDNLNAEEVTRLEIPTGIPIVYHFSDDLRNPSWHYLGQPERD
ncbi:MAG: 2,3-diphosphoglycerate-dependent phosphoglycerate mutase [Desulfofustis sp.]